MDSLRAARVLYQVHSPRIAELDRGEVLAAMGRHPVPTGSLEVTTLQSGEDRQAARDLLPPSKDFDPPLSFDGYAQLRQAKWIYRVEATEVEPEDLGYLRAALLVAGEIAALTDGLIVDPLALSVLAPEDVVTEVGKPFDPLRHVAIHVDRGSAPFWVHSHGMEKFAHADFEMHGVPRESIDVARGLLRNLVAAVISGGHFEAGEETQLCGFAFVFGPSSAATAPHYSSASLTLQEFRLVADTATPEMQAMLSCPA